MSVEPSVSRRGRVQGRACSERPEHGRRGTNACRGLTSALAPGSLAAYLTQRLSRSNRGAALASNRGQRLVRTRAELLALKRAGAGPRIGLLCATLVSSLLCVSHTLPAQDPRTQPAAAPVPSDTSAGGTSNAHRLIAASRTNETIDIDGKLNEAAWARAQPVSNFVQAFPKPGAAPTERTEVRVLYDNHALYVGVRAFDNHPDSIVAQLARRDATGIYSDWIHIVVDSYHDHRTGFRFSVNPRGVQKDALEYDDSNEDLNWDAVWEAATAVDSLGWTVEYRIPLSQLRFTPMPPDAERVWGLVVQRDVARYQERDTWSPWTPQSPGLVSTAGDIIGLRGIALPSRLEVLPYASGALTRMAGPHTDPFYRHNKVRPSIGGDIKYGLPAGLTLSATINPDFGQVEVDPAVVNLTAFETYYPEKRPFFLEGSDVFQFGQVQANNDYQPQYFFYSRRIGRQPERSVGGPDVLYTDAPDRSAILGAGKATGKIKSWTIGLLDAVTSRETARYETASGVLGTTPVEPLTNYAVGRVQRDFGSTIIGAMATAVGRSGSDPVLSGMLRKKALFGGMDFLHDWADRQWAVSGYVGASNIFGSSSAITATEESSTHYFQRPDAEYLQLDRAKTRLTGYIDEIALQRRGEWFGSLAYKESSPGLELNDLGYQERADYRSLSSFIGFQTSEAGKHFQNFSLYAQTTSAWNFGGNSIDQQYAAVAGVTFTNSSVASAQASYSPEQLDDRLTRGGPLAKLPAEWQLSLHSATDSRRWIVVGATASASADAARGSSASLAPSIDLRPAPSIRLSITPTASVLRNSEQYVRTAIDTLDTGTYGRRYVFAHLRQITTSMDTRLDWTFSTKLSLQLYAQPFVSSGSYSAYKELVAPKTRRFATYGLERGAIMRDSLGVYTIDPDGNGLARPFQVPDPNFSLRSLRGDAVLRWEYRPGSALFVVWQQQRSDVLSTGNFDFRQDVGAIFRTSPTNIFLVKVTYWLGL